VRGQILEQLSKLGSLSHVFALTFNVDLVFIERWVLPALRKCGHPSLSIVADAGCAAESFARQRAYAPRLGKRYRVAPLPLAHAAAFHPKAILATSDARATLFIGSGNVSFGGWFDNAEVWARYDSDGRGPGEISAFRQYLDEVLGRLVDAESIRRELGEATDQTKRLWARHPPPPNGLVGRVGSGPSLLERAQVLIGDEPVDEMIVAAPYYDLEAAAVGDLAARSRAKSVRLLVPADGSTLTRQARQRVDPTWTVEATRVLRGPRERSAFVHAKWYAFIRGDTALVLAGSANASRAAWTMKGDAGNAELLAVRTMTVEELRSDVLGELAISSEEPELPDESELEDDAPTQMLAIVVVARQQRGSLRVSWHTTSEANVVEVRVDGVKADWHALAANAIEVEWALPAARVSLSVMLDEGPAIEVDAWVDDERELATSARERRMADLVDDYAKDGAGDLSGWMAILEPFEAELREAAASARMKEAAARRAANDDAPIRYEWSDVFPDEEDAASGPAAILFAGRTGGGRASQMRSILLHALDALLPDDDGDDDVEGTDIDDDAAAVGKVADRRPKGPIPNRPPAPPPSAQALARACKTVKRATDALTDPRLLAHRAPRQLQRDITMLATLLRVARREGWIDTAMFAQLSASALTTLLVAGEMKGKTALPPLPVGWLEERRRVDPEQRFVEDIAATGFVAALCAWLSDALEAATTDDERGAIEHAGVAAFSTLRWLFERTRASSFGTNLARSVAIASAGDPGDAWESARHAWRRWDRSGRGVLLLQNSLRMKKVGEWRKIGRVVARGDLVYTGKGLLGLAHRVESDGSRLHVVVVAVTGATPVIFDAAYVVAVDDALVLAIGGDAPRWLADVRATIDRMCIPAEVTSAFAW
jgi:hypothetical protein